MTNTVHDKAPPSSAFQRRMEARARLASPPSPAAPASPVPGISAEKHAKSKAAIAAAAAAAAMAAAVKGEWTGAPECSELKPAQPPNLETPEEMGGGGGVELHAAAPSEDAEASQAYDDLARQALEDVRAMSREIGFSRDMAARCDALADEAPPRVPRHSWVWTHVLLRGSKLERAYVLQQIRATYGQVELGRMLAAVFEPLEGGGYRYDWGDECARRQLGKLVMSRACARVMKLQSLNGSPSRRLVLGVCRLPQVLFMRALPRASGQPFSRRTHSRDSQRLHRLILKIVRPPADRVPKNEVGPSGQNCNRYVMERLKRRTAARSTTKLGAEFLEPDMHSQWADLGQWAELQRIERRPRGAAISDALQRKRRDAQLAAAVGPPAPQ